MQITYVIQSRYIIGLRVPHVSFSNIHKGICVFIAPFKLNLAILIPRVFIFWYKARLLYLDLLLSYYFISIILCLLIVIRSRRARYKSHDSRFTIIINVSSKVSVTTRQFTPICVTLCQNFTVASAKPNRSSESIYIRSLPSLKGLRSEENEVAAQRANSFPRRKLRGVACDCTCNAPADYFREWSPTFSHDTFDPMILASRRLFARLMN